MKHNKVVITIITIIVLGALVATWHYFDMKAKRQDYEDFMDNLARDTGINYDWRKYE